MFPIWVNDGSSEMPTDPIFYVVAKDGIYLKKSMGHFTTLSKVNSISILGECETFANLNVAKIKKKQFTQILSLFREVYKKYKSEANIILHYNIKKKKYMIDIPPQGVSGGSVNYENGLETYKGYIRIGTIHSHANMSAFHSGVDQGDENHWDGLHITLGRMGEKYFDISCSIMSSKERFMVNPQDYIEDIEVIEFEEKSMFPAFRYVNGVREEIKHVSKKLGWDIINPDQNDFIFPQDWMKKIDKYRPVIKHHNLQIANSNSIAEFYRNFSTYPNHHNLGHHAAAYNVEFEVDPGGWSPCAQCPYKNHKSDILMKEILEELAADENSAEEFISDELYEFDEDLVNGNIEDNENFNNPFYVDDSEGVFGINQNKKKF